ncbi:DUF1146 domain-containing protein [Bacillus sp. HMF5848]|uniref:DUF1146 family protein n=1 Tax=Bacillus sp. HMF5848 TaxID=2495421 RepID=UPI000F78F303|nr:DUF1146 family protein [Bacillus sp. HMF5848]RSK28926.1 DUF1146 domain-containing protein [Bacillus sp. HMF5848]
MDLLPSYSQFAVISLMSHLFFIVITWYALQGVQLEKFIKANRIMQARLLYILLTVAIGSSVSNFFLDYFLWSQQLPSMFVQ